MAAKKKLKAKMVERGTPTWGINKLRTDLLVALLNDLQTLEKDGLDEDKCVIVTQALGQVTNSATAIPDGSFWRRTIWSRFQKFEDIYREWNEINGSDPDSIFLRTAKLRELRKQRNRIATKIRVNQYILTNELDLNLIRDCYDALGGITKAFPDLFKALTKSLDRCNRRLDS
jgi:hypothetical protein